MILVILRLAGNGGFGTNSRQSGYTWWLGLVVSFVGYQCGSVTPGPKGEPQFLSLVSQLVPSQSPWPLLQKHPQMINPQNIAPGNRFHLEYWHCARFGNISFEHYCLGNLSTFWLTRLCNFQGSWRTSVVPDSETFNFFEPQRCSKTICGAIVRWF